MAQPARYAVPILLHRLKPAARDLRWNELKRREGLPLCGSGHGARRHRPGAGGVQAVSGGWHWTPGTELNYVAGADAAAAADAAAC